MNPVQDLYHECAKVAHYNNEDLKTVAAAMGRIDLECLGESENTLPKQYCEFVEVANEQGFQMALFKIPAGQQIPLHDHPGMTVFSKVLSGSVSVHSYDKLSNNIPEIGGTLDAALVKNGEIWTAATGVHITLPGKGNLHQMTALEPVCLLDVLTPPYGDYGSERDCSYFEVAAQEGRAVTLRRVECPMSFFTLSSPYCGLPVHGYAANHQNAARMPVSYQDVLDSVDPSFLRAPSEEGAVVVPSFAYVSCAAAIHGAERVEKRAKKEHFELGADNSDHLRPLHSQQY